jgi:hypothetical protein
VRKLTISCIASAVILLSGCGGGGGTSDGGDSTTTTGTVSGSYYAHAKVCLDANGNGACDTGETSVQSNNDGSYSISGNLSYDIVAEIKEGTVKYDDNGDELKTFLSSDTPLTFVAPRKATNSDSKVVISSISTKVWSSMKENGETLANAKKSVARALNLDEDKMFEDFNRLTDETLKAKFKAQSDLLASKIEDANGSISTLKQALTADVIPESQRDANVSTIELPSKIDVIK